MSSDLKYIDVILPSPVKGVFQYSYKSDIELEVGQRVIVQFGLKKLYTAIVFKKYENKNILLRGLKLQAQRSQFGYGIESILWCGFRTSFG